MTAVIYARYSSDNQREESIEGQIRECTAYAEKNGITVVKHYIDRALSAKTDNRPDFQQMIKDSEKRLFDIVLVWKLDRFARNRYDSAHYEYQLERNHVKLVSATEPISDSPAGIMVKSMLTGMAEYYSAELSEKVVRGMTENVLKGKYNGGTIPIGFKVDEEKFFQIDPLKAPFVVEAFQRYNDGATMKELMNWLNDSGVTTNRNQKFTYNSVQTMLTNKRYIGENHFKDIVMPDSIPAIVDKDLFEEVQQKIKKNSRAPARHKAEDDYLLTTKLFCGMCGAMMFGECGTGRNKVVHHYYKCATAKRFKTCKKKTVRKEWLEDLVIAETMKLIQDDAVIDAIVAEVMELQDQENTTLPLLEKQMREVENGIENMLNAIQAGVLTNSTKSRLEKLEAQQKELAIRIAEEKIARPRLSENQVRFWLTRFRKLDPNVKSHRETLINTFVNAVYLYDEKVLITFNYKDGTKTITFDEIAAKDAPEGNGSDLGCFAPPKKHEGSGLRASFLLIHTVLFSSVFESHHAAYRRPAYRLRGSYWAVRVRLLPHCGRSCFLPQIASDPAVCSMSISRRPVILGGKWNETMEEQTMKYGVIDVGGGLRGIYGAGVLDRCLEEDLRFDLCIGVSAGSANMASYLAGQHGRNKPFYDEYSFRREYMSVHNLIRKHSYLDLSYVYGTLSNAGGENPLDYAALARSPAEFCVVAANAQNGEAQYFTKADLHPDDYRVLMASCCIPVIDQPCVIDGVPYFDGGLADPVPLEWAFAHGCDRVALILTKPIGLVSSDVRDKHLAHLLQSHYPAAAEGLRRRAWRYNTAVQRARELERQGLVCIIAPDNTEGMSTLTKNRAGLEKMYAKGKQDAEALVRWMQNTKQDESVGT